METAIAATVISPPPRPRCGAPTLYREEFCDMVVEWFAKTPLPGLQSPDAMEAVRQTYAAMPTFQSFAGSIGVSTKLLYDWQNRHATFREACARAKDVQSQWFIAGLNSGDMNPTGAIFVAKNILGWRDKIDIEQTSGAVAAGFNDLKAMMQVGTPEELTAFGSIIETWQKRLIEQQSIAAA